jgi:hypothetical protein
VRASTSPCTTRGTARSTTTTWTGQQRCVAASAGVYSVGVAAIAPPGSHHRVRRCCSVVALLPQTLSAVQSVQIIVHCAIAPFDCLVVTSRCARSGCVGCDAATACPVPLGPPSLLHGLCSRVLRIIARTCGCVDGDGGRGSAVQSCSRRVVYRGVPTVPANSTLTPRPHVCCVACRSVL